MATPLAKTWIGKLRLKPDVYPSQKHDCTSRKIKCNAQGSASGYNSIAIPRTQFVVFNYPLNNSYDLPHNPKKIFSLYSRNLMAFIRKPIFFFIRLIFFITLVYACGSSNKSSKKEISKNDSLANYPYWISMMDSPNVNYYKAVAAFNKYWEHREKPTEEDGEAKDIYGKVKSKEEKEKEANRSTEYVYEYKRFLNWQQRNKNLVKPDGTIMTPEEIIEQWKKNQTDTL